MRFVAVILILLFSTGFATAEQQKPSVNDWFFGCHKPDPGEKKEDQPCWVQSTVSSISGHDLLSDGTLHLQVHFFTAKKVLRVFIARKNIADLQVLRRDSPGGHSSFTDQQMTNLTCSPKTCVFELQIDDAIIQLIQSSPSLSVFGQSKKSKFGVGWAHYDVLTTAGFAEAIAKLRTWHASQIK